MSILFWYVVELSTQCVFFEIVSFTLHVESWTWAKKISTNQQTIHQPTNQTTCFLVKHKSTNQVIKPPNWTNIKKPTEKSWICRLLSSCSASTTSILFRKTSSRCQLHLPAKVTKNTFWANPQKSEQQNKTNTKTQTQQKQKNNQNTHKSLHSSRHELLRLCRGFRLQEATQVLHEGALKLRQVLIPRWGETAAGPGGFRFLGSFSKSKVQKFWIKMVNVILLSKTSIAKCFSWRCVCEKTRARSGQCFWHFLTIGPEAMSQGNLSLHSLANPYLGLLSLWMRCWRNSAKRHSMLS